MSLVRNPEYHGRFMGNVQRVELCLVVDRSALVDLYEADRLDILDLTGLPQSEMERIRQRHAGEYVSVPCLGITYIGFDAGRPPFNDPRVRRALVLATDRETVVNAAMGGYHFPALDGFIAPGMPGHSPGIGLPYDPIQARQLLDEAGYAGGRGFPHTEWLVSSARADQAEYLQAHWREKLGIEIALEIMEWGPFLDRLTVQPPHMFTVGWGADYPDPDDFLRVGLLWEQIRWRNEAYDELVREAKLATDQGERIRLYRRADRILAEEAPIMPLDYVRLHLLVKPWVIKYPMSGIGYWFFRNVIIEPH